MRRSCAPVRAVAAPRPAAVRPVRVAQAAPRRAYGGGHHDAHHGHGHGQQKKNHPHLLDEDPEWINDPRDAYYVRSISAEHRATNKDLDAAYRHMSVYIQPEQIAKPGVHDELRQADLLRKAKVDAAKAAAQKAYEEEKKAQEGQGWRKWFKRS